MTITRQIKGGQVRGDKQAATLRNNSYVNERFNYQPLFTAGDATTALVAPGTGNFIWSGRNLDMRGAYIGSNTIITPLYANPAFGVRISLDNAVGEGMNLKAGASAPNSASIFQHRVTDDDFEPQVLRAVFIVDIPAAVDPVFLGYAVSGFQSILANYDDLAGISLSLGDVDYWGLDGASGGATDSGLDITGSQTEFEFKIIWEAHPDGGSRFSFYLDGDYVAQYHHTGGSLFYPYIQTKQAGVTGDFYMKELECGPVSALSRGV